MTAESIFLAAVEKASPSERAAYLEQVCQSDPNLRAWVSDLLRAHDRVGNFLEDALFDSVPTEMMDAVDAGPIEGAGAIIGPYRLRERIGEGGMGVIYVAEQMEPVRRKVALKLIKPGMDSRQVVARFDVERQALALMDHPNIAKVYDAGTTPLGHPYFVMELVRGIPITDYCDRERLSISDRLQLFVLVCRAVQHAHQKGIIHRDLKPANILVTVVDGQPVPKVIDFGVAKATGTLITDQTVYTALHQMVGTPLYMSPEQADLCGVDVDTRSDVYSLGVLLYELLTGTTPFEPETLRLAAYEEIRRIIREVDPPRPSTRLTPQNQSVATISLCRKADPHRLGTTLRGELDWIVMKSLEKDRRRRYETANDLAADVSRYLADEPVTACPPSVTYRVGKFATRNRAMLTTVAIVMLALLAGMAGFAWQAAVATRASAQAERRANESREIVDYLVKDVLSAASLNNKAAGHSVTVVELLSDMDATLSDRFRDQPLVEAAIRTTMGLLYGEAGRHDEALPQYERAFEIRKQVLGFEHPETLETAHELVYWLKHRGRKDDAIDLGRLVLQTRQRNLGLTHPDSLFSQARLAFVMRGVPEFREESMELSSSAVDAALQALSPDHFVTNITLDAHSILLRDRGEMASAVRHSRQAAEGFERVVGPLHTETLWSRQHLAKTLEAAGRIAEARVVASETQERFARVHGVAHNDTWLAIRFHVRLLEAAHDYPALRDLALDWTARVLSNPGDQQPWAVRRRSGMLQYLVLVLASLPNDILFDPTLPIRAAEEAVASQRGWYSWSALGALYVRLGRFDEARKAFHAAERQPDWEGGNDLHWFARANFHARQRDWPQARECIERATSLETKHDSWTSIVSSLRASAESALHGATQINPQPDG